MRLYWPALRWSAAILALGLATGCQQPASSETANASGGCSAGQKMGGSIGSAFGAILGQATTSLASSGEAGAVLAPLNVTETSSAGFGLLGSEIGCALTTEDQKKAVSAVQVTTISGQPQTWSGTQPGVSGQTQVIASSGQCRTVQQTVTLADNSQRTGQTTSCNGPNGWQVTSP